MTVQPERLEENLGALKWFGVGESELSRVGPYQILREIGQGGMGTVYLAARDDDQFKKRVAIKIVKRGMDMDSIERRFRNERQILAGLDHPHIARLLDGGTTEDGRPYFVMEYVEGLPLHEFCDTRKLPTIERLKLFRKVCSAVQYAHQNLVVHRDIKPKNILVTEEGEPKLLDFGIAKLLKPELYSQAIEETLPADRHLTPEYASPEQARGDRVTTATDVYSLGVVLYELLTGHSLYRFKGLATYEVMRLICEGMPTKPSSVITREEESQAVDGAVVAVSERTVSDKRSEDPRRLRRRLSGDLDNIVLKALAKEPHRRYASVAEFSEDIRRHLEGAPVSARPATLTYRTQKFLQRHKVGVAAALLVVLAVLSGVVSTIHQAGIARAQRARAERRFNDVRKLANSFLFELHEAIENLPGSTPARELLVKRALEYLDSLASEAGDDPSLQRELAIAYQKVGDVQGNPFGPSLGQAEGALASYRKALALSEALAKGEPGNADLQRDLAKSHVKVGDAQWITGNLKDAGESYRTALEINLGLVAASPEDVASRQALSQNYKALGDVLGDMNDLEGALANQRKALAIDRALLGSHPSPPAQRDVAVSLLKVGNALEAERENGAALASVEESVAIFEVLFAADSTSARSRSDLATSYQVRGDILVTAGRKTEGVENHLKALRHYEWLSAADPRNAGARRSLVVAYNRVAPLLAKTDDASSALKLFSKALAEAEAIFALDQSNTQARRDMSVCYYGMASVQGDRGDYTAALANYRRAAAMDEALLAEEPGNPRRKCELAEVHLALGKALRELGDRTRSLESDRAAVSYATGASCAASFYREGQIQLAEAYFRVGRSAADLARSSRLEAGERSVRRKEALAWLEESKSIWLRLSDECGLPRAKAEIRKCETALADLDAQIR